MLKSTVAKYKERYQHYVRKLNDARAKKNLPPHKIQLDPDLLQTPTAQAVATKNQSNVDLPKNAIERAVSDVTTSSWRPCARDFLIFRDYTQGKADLWKLGEINELDYTSIWCIVKKVERWLGSQTLYEIAGLRVRATARADFLAQEAIDAWHASKRDKITTTETSRAMKNGQVADDTTTRETSAGNPAFLHQARECLDMVLRIWGGYSPKQLELKDTSEESAQRVGGRSAVEALQVRAATINERLSKMLSETQPGIEHVVEPAAEGPDQTEEQS